MMKKIISIISAILVSSLLFAVEFDLRILPEYSFVSSPIYENAFGGSVGFDISPFSLRNNKDTVYFGVQAAANVLNTAVKDVTNFTIEGIFSLGYNFRLNDRFGLSIEGFFGGFNIPEASVPDEYVELIGAPKLSPVSGLIGGGRLFANYYVRPELVLSLYGGYKSYISHPEFMHSIEVGAGLKYNINKGLFSKSEVTFEEVSFTPLFPVFYSRYDEHEFGNITVKNNESNDIKDVNVSVLIEQYMTAPKQIASFDVVKKGESFSTPVTAFLNENILNSMQLQKADATLIVEYTSLGKKMRNEQVVELTTLSRNSMTWEDDRSASAFVSGSDNAARQFARQVASVIKHEIDPSIPKNIQYAAALFSALKLYGINYVVDPASAFTDNIGTSSVDFLQFPYQTLMYHGGDCDDLSILNSSLLEALGISAAFITVPGHIFIGFDSGITEAEAESVLVQGKYIVKDGKVWIPLEITLCQDTFTLAWSYGAKEWNQNGDEAVILPIESCQQEFDPVSIPESAVKLDMPSRSDLKKEFKKTMSNLKGKYLKK